MDKDKIETMRHKLKR